MFGRADESGSDEKIPRSLLQVSRLVTAPFGMSNPASGLLPETGEWYTDSRMAAMCCSNGDRLGFMVGGCWLCGMAVRHTQRKPKLQHLTHQVQLFYQSALFFFAHQHGTAAGLGQRERCCFAGFDGQGFVV